jgi:hypothetical protein
MRAVGDAWQPITSCPHCSVLVSGTCVPCKDGDTHPACENCVGGRHIPPKPPWYENQLLNAIITTTVVTVVSGLFLEQIKKRWF